MVIIEIAEEIYEYEKQTGNKVTINHIKEKYHVSKYNATKIRSLVDSFHEIGYSFSSLKSVIANLENENKKLKRSYNKKLKTSGSLEYILKQIERRISEIDIEIQYKDTKVNSFEYAQDIILLISDTHFGEVEEIKSPDGFGYINKYNLEIAKQRTKQLVNKVKHYTEIHRSYSNIDTIHICFLGDIVSGHQLHYDLDMTNEVNIVDQVLESVNILSSLVLELCEIFPNVKLYGVPGNHGRTTKKKDFKQPTNNFDILVYKVLERELSTLTKLGKVKNNIQFLINDSSSFIITRIRNSTVLMTHGDNIRSWAGIPYYGMMRDYAAKQEMSIAAYQTPVNYVVMGHFHHPITINRPMGGIIVNGSLKGPDKFSIDNNYFFKPSQTLFSIDDNGKNFLYEIILD